MKRSLSSRVTTISQSLSFRSKALPFVLELPQDTQGKCVVLLHGASGSLETPHLAQIASMLSNIGFATFRYTCKSNLKGRTMALEQILQYLQDQHEMQSFSLIGHSMGCRVIAELTSSSTVYNVENCVFLSYPLHPPGKEWRDMTHFERIKSIPLLFLAGSKDGFVSKQDLETAFTTMNVDHLRSNLRIVEVTGGNHSLKVKKKVPECVYEEVVSFVSSGFRSDASKRARTDEDLQQSDEDEDL